MSTYTGSCLCGGIRFRIQGDLGPIQICHCTQCRKAQGTAIATNVPVNASAFTLEQGADLLSAFEDTPGKHRVFCTVCGSPVFSKRDTLPGVLRIRLGLINEHIDSPLKAHCYVGSKANWWPVSDGLPQYRGPDGSDRLDGGSESPEDAAAHESDPAPETPVHLHPVLAELMAREPIFHRPERGTSRADFERMTSDDFWEVGASGRRYSRSHVLDVLEQRHACPVVDEWQTRDFHCRHLSEQDYLLTYTLHQGKRITRRSTIWRRVPGDWVIVFHQGTLVQE